MSVMAPPAQGGHRFSTFAPVIVGDSVFTEQQWLWAGRIPKGAYTVVTGAPCSGKSTVLLKALADLAAGHSLPGQNGAPKPVRTCWLTLEEIDTLGPKAELAGMPKDALVVPPTQMFDQLLGKLSDSSTAMEFVAWLEAQGCTVLVLDGVLDWIGVRDEKKQAEVRQGLRSLIQAASAGGVTVIGIMHNRKGLDGKARDALAGSVAFVGLPRSVLTCCTLGSGSAVRRFLASTKLNIGRPPSTVEFEIVGRDNYSRGWARWVGEVNLTDDQLRSLDREPEEDGEWTELMCGLFSRDEWKLREDALAEWVGEGGGTRNFAKVIQSLLLAGRLIRQTRADKRVEFRLGDGAPKETLKE